MLRKIVLAGAFFASSLVMAGSTLPKVSGTTESGQKESLVKSLELSRDGDYCIAKVRIRHINSYWEMCYAYRNDKVYVTLWFDWEGTGKPSSTVKYHVFRKTEEVTMCIPVYIPKKHVSVVSVRAMVDSDQCSVNPAVMPKRGSYLDGSFDAGWGGEAPAFYRVNVGTYAEDIMGTILFKPYQDLGEGLFFDN